MATQVTSGHWLNPRPNMIYDILSYIEPGLFVDVGAAAGAFTALMSRRSPASHIHALEPFPGNWPLLDAAVSDLAQVTVDRRAASDHTGVSRLFVSQVVTGDEKGWSDKVGYSSSGTLISEVDPRYDRGIDVETVRLDDAIDEHVRFLKIDVQGTELAVLQGAERLIQQQSIDLMWVEFSGQLEILSYLQRDYAVFDSHYLLVPRRHPPSEDDWQIVGTKNLSNGREAFLAWPQEYPRSATEYCDWFQAMRAEFIIQTDLTFVLNDFLDSYLPAAGHAIGRLKKSPP